MLKNMNKERRKQLDEIISKLEDIKQDIVSLQDEEQEYFDNMPEALPQIAHPTGRSPPCRER